MITRRNLLTHGAAAASMLVAGCRPSPATGPATKTPQSALGADPPSPPDAAIADSDPASTTRDPWAALRGLCDGVEPVSEAERSARRARAARLLDDAGADVLVVEAGTNLDYLLGVRWRASERPLLGIVGRDGDPVVVAPAFEHHTLAERVPDDSPAQVVDWAEHMGAYAPAVAAIRRISGKKRPVVRLDPAMRMFVAQGLRVSVDARVGSSIFSELRSIKTPAELARLRRANEATKASIKLAAAQVEPGMRESEIATLIREAQSAAGLQDIWVLALAGPNAAFPHGTRNERTLVDGDLVLVDTGGGLHGYQSDITRTWAVGTPSDRARTAYATVREAQAAAFAAIGPGVAAGDVDAAARQVIAARGFGDAYSAFTHRLGHGIGMRGHEDPYLVKDSAVSLRPGMTFSNEPGIYLRGELGVRIEDIFVVTDDGYEVFGPRVTSLDEPFG